MKNTQVTINEPLSATACKANQKKLTCTKPPQPGSTQGNCHFDGAMVSVRAITDAVHLVHGAVSCTHNPWATHGSLSSGSQLYQTAFTTDFSEGNIVFGGEKKLYKAIVDTALCATNWYSSNSEKNSFGVVGLSIRGLLVTTVVLLPKYFAVKTSCISGPSTKRAVPYCFACFRTKAVGKLE